MSDIRSSDNVWRKKKGTELMSSKAEYHPCKLFVMNIPLYPSIEFVEEFEISNKHILHILLVFVINPKQNGCQNQQLIEESHIV